MIKINKPKDVPQKLVDVQNTIAQQLYARKEGFRWGTEHYSDPIKGELKTLYNNKCGFCEIILTEQDTENKFTVEHFRPRSIYYWLGAEWTNLFPTCKSCNNQKDNNFPLLLERNRFDRTNPPFNKKKSLIKSKCKADCQELLSEKALYIHPEIAIPESYFVFEPSGEVKVNEENLDTYQKEQAKIMILKFLGRPSVEEKRKRIVISFQNKLRDVLINSFMVLGGKYSNENILMFFWSFFNELSNQQKPETEFSLLGYYMNKDFNKFFLEKIENDNNIELRKLAEHARMLYMKYDPTT